METIYRYDAAMDDRIEIMMPAGSQIIHVAASDRIRNGIALWAICDPEKTAVPHVLYVRGTGHPLGDAASARHLGTVALPDTFGTLWFHVFAEEVV
jgi:hypothetical protein